MSEYAEIADLGSLNNMYNDPTLYSMLDGVSSQFMFGGGVGFQKGNYLASEWMSNRCAAGWDGVCQAASENPQKWYPRPQCCPQGLTDGQAMLREAAFKHFLLSAKNCYSICEPFDPTVADSPLVCRLTDTAPTTGSTPAAFWLLDGRKVDGGCALDYPPCEKVYGFTNKQMKYLDSNAIMNNLLDFPMVAIDLLQMLAKWARQTGNMSRIERTRFGQFVKAHNL